MQKMRGAITGAAREKEAKERKGQKKKEQKREERNSLWNISREIKWKLFPSTF